MGVRGRANGWCEVVRGGAEVLLGCSRIGQGVVRGWSGDGQGGR